MCVGGVSKKKQELMIITKFTTYNYPKNYRTTRVDPVVWSDYPSWITCHMHHGRGGRAAW